MTSPVEPSVSAVARSHDRIVWVDAVRGFSVAAVVLFHGVVWLLLGPVEGDVAPSAAGAWDTITSYLGSARMPVLLAVSGLVVARRVRTGGIRAVLQRSIETIYLYVVWLLIYAVVFVVLQSPWLPHFIDGPRDLVTQLVAPDTTLWYLLAIAIYPVILTAIRSVHPVIVLGVLAVLAVGVPLLDWQGLWAKIPALAVYYAMGVYGAGQIRALGDAARWWWLAPTGAGVLATLIVGRVVHTEVGHALLGLVRGVVFLLALVIGVALAVRLAPIGRVGSALGRRTLGVYVLHAILIDVILVMAHGPLASVHQWLVGIAPIAFIYPLVVTAAVLMTSLWLRWAMTRWGLGVLFVMPAAWRDRLRERIQRPISP